MNFAQYRQAIQGIYAQYRDAVAEAQLVFDRSMGEAFSLFKGDSDMEDGPLEFSVPDSKKYRG